MSWPAQHRLLPADDVRRRHHFCCCCWRVGVGGGSADADAARDVLHTSSGAVRAALGLAWSACVNTRLLLDRAVPVYHSEGGGVGGDERRVSVVFAPHVAEDTVACRITADGVVPL